LGFVTTFLSLVVLLPIAALVWTSGRHGWHDFWAVVSAPEAVAALKLTLGAALVVSAVNAVLGTVTAWVLVRDDFRGKSIVNAVIDLPFALPTIVAGLVVLASVALILLARQPRAATVRRLPRRLPEAAPERAAA
jgi:sulfate transport system permease protein